MGRGASRPLRPRTLKVCVVLLAACLARALPEPNLSAMDGPWNNVSFQCIVQEVASVAPTGYVARQRGSFSSSVHRRVHSGQSPPELSTVSHGVAIQVHRAVGRTLDMGTRHTKHSVMCLRH
jgi:hypothetical protein